MYVLHDIEHSELYGGLPKDPHIPLLVRVYQAWLDKTKEYATNRDDLVPPCGVIAMVWGYVTRHSALTHHRPRYEKVK